MGEVKKEKSLQRLSISQRITNQSKKAIKFLRRFRGLWLRVFDFIVIVAAYIIAQILAENTIPYLAITNSMLWESIIVAVLVYMLMFKVLRLYKNITRFENRKLISCICNCLLCSLLNNGCIININSSSYSWYKSTYDCIFNNNVRYYWI